MRSTCRLCRGPLTPNAETYAGECSSCGGIEPDLAPFADGARERRLRLRPHGPRPDDLELDR